MEATSKPNRTSRLGQALLALLLCVTCIPAQSLAFAQQAWAADEAPYGYAVYYQPADSDMYTLVLQSTPDIDDSYGKYVHHFELKGGGPDVSGLCSLAPDPNPDEDYWNILSKETELADKVSSVLVRDRIKVPASTNRWFFGMRNLTKVDLANLDMSEVTSMMGMFSDCPALEPVDFSHTSLQKVRYAEELFSSCESLQSVKGLTMGSLEDYREPSAGADAAILYGGVEQMFKGCSSLVSVDLSHLRSTAKLESFDSMFSNCSKLQEVDLSNMRFGGNALFSVMFESCTSLTTVKMPGGTTSAEGPFTRTFADCTSVRMIDLSGITVSPTAATPPDGMFANCSQLKVLSWPKGLPGSTEVFADCSSLEKIAADDASLISYLPQRDTTSIPGATGKWVYSNGFCVPEIMLQPEWIEAIPTMTYTGSPLQPTIRINANGTNLQNGSDFVAEYKDNINPGTATVTIKGQGQYTGQIERSFTIVKPSETPTPAPTPTPTPTPGSSNASTSSSSTTPPAASDITIGTGSSSTDAGSNSVALGSRPVINIVINGVTLREGVDFTVSYRNADKVGIAIAIIVGKDPYHWTKTVSFAVGPKGTRLKKFTLAKKKTTVYWGKQTKQVDGYQVRYSTKKTMKGSKRLTVKGSSRTSAKLPRLKVGKKMYVQVRTYKKIKGKTYYSSWSSKMVVSNPPRTAISKTKVGKRNVRVVWKKKSKKWVSGYQVRWSTKKTMKNAKKITVRNPGKTSAKMTKLKSGKKYYVQVRTFKKTGKKTYCSPWSKAKAVKTKK